MGTSRRKPSSGHLLGQVEVELHHVVGDCRRGRCARVAWRAVDPVLSSNDAGKPHDNPEIAVDMGIPDQLRWVEQALTSMMRQYPLRALVLYTEYTVAISQAVKARMVAEKYGGSKTLRQYRYERSRGLDLLRGRIAA